MTNKHVEARIEKNYNKGRLLTLRKSKLKSFDEYRDIQLIRINNIIENLDETTISELVGESAMVTKRFIWELLISTGLIFVLIENNFSEHSMSTVGVSTFCSIMILGILNDAGITKLLPCSRLEKKYHEKRLRIFEQANISIFDLDYLKAIHRDIEDSRMLKM